MTGSNTIKAGDIVLFRLRGFDARALNEESQNSFKAGDAVEGVVLGVGGLDPNGAQILDLALKHNFRGKPYLVLDVPSGASEACWSAA